MESIGTSAFNRCSSLQEVVFGKGLASIGSMCFNYCHKLERFVVDEANPNFKGVDGVLYNKNVDTLVLYPQNQIGCLLYHPGDREHIGPTASMNRSCCRPSPSPPSLRPSMSSVWRASH